MLAATASTFGAMGWRQLGAHNRMGAIGRHFIKVVQVSRRLWQEHLVHLVCVLAMVMPGKDRTGMGGDVEGRVGLRRCGTGTRWRATGGLPLKVQGPGSVDEGAGGR